MSREIAMPIFAVIKAAEDGHRICDGLDGG